MRVEKRPEKEIGTLKLWVTLSGAPFASPTFTPLNCRQVPSTLEICLVKRTRVASQFPLLALFSGVARMMRPVRNLACGADELIGTFEQVYMNICVVPSEGVQGVSVPSFVRWSSRVDAPSTLRHQILSSVAHALSVEKYFVAERSSVKV